MQGRCMLTSRKRIEPQGHDVHSSAERVMVEAKAMNWISSAWVCFICLRVGVIEDSCPESSSGGQQSEAQ